MIFFSIPVILKDVSYSVMSELLQFMYQGEVNVKHIELPTFMKIAETLQIKGLTTPSSQKSVSSPGMHHPSSSSSHLHRRATSPMQQHQQQQHIPNKNINSSDSNLSSPPPSQQQQQQSYTNNQSSKLETPGSSGGNQKRGATDYITSTPNNNDSYAGYTKVKVPKRSVGSSDVTENSNGPDMNNDSMDNMTDEVFMPPIPQISMSEGRFDLNNVKRENPENANSPAPRHSNPYYEYNNAPSGASSSSGYTPNKDYANDMHDFANKGHHMEIPAVAPGEKWFQGKLQFMLSQRGKPLLVHNGENFGIQYVRKDKKYWQCNLSRKYNCKARVTTTDNDDIIVTNAEHCHTEIRAHLRKEYKLNKMNQLAHLHSMQQIQHQQQQEQEKRHREEHENRMKEEQHRIIEHLKKFSNHNNNSNNDNNNNN